jgi:hypothetical protein
MVAKMGEPEPNEGSFNTGLKRTEASFNPYMLWKVLFLANLLFGI